DVAGVDLVFDVLGGDIAKRSVGVIRSGGTLVTITGPTEARPAGGLTIDFIVVPDRAQLSELVQRVRDGRLRTNIGNVSTLDDAVAAFNPTERIKGKTIIRVRGGCAGRMHPRSVLHRPAAASRVGGDRSTNRRRSGSPGCRRGVPTGGRDSSVPNETPPRQSRAAGGWRWVIPGAANPSLPISIGDSRMKTIVAMSRTCLLLTVLTAL